MRWSRCRAQLAQAIVRDGEGATKFITVRVEGGASEAECRQVAYAIAPLAAGEDRVLRERSRTSGRILAAVGYAGIDDLDQTPDRPLPRRRARRRSAAGAIPSYREEDGQRVMKQSEITVRVDLHRGAAAGDGLDLRPVARLRQHQRRLPLLIARRRASPLGVGAPQRE